MSKKEKKPESERPEYKSEDNLRSYIVVLAALVLMVGCLTLACYGGLELWIKLFSSG